MNNWTIKFKQAVLSFLTITMAITGSNTIGGAGLATAVLIASSSDSAARTVRGASRSRTRTTHRGTTHRSVSRTTTRHTARPVAAPAVRSTARRTSRRTARRVTRRHFYTLPVGYAAVTLGGYRYYRYGGVYYYPYYISGQTVYVEVEVDPDDPSAPPPVESVTEEYEIDD